MTPRKSLWLLVLLAAFTFESARSEECRDFFDFERYGLSDFLRRTKFGTVGVRTSASGRIAVVSSGCIDLKRLRPKSVQVYFNHRNSRETKVGYVSFKLYGLSSDEATSSVLKLARKGEWVRKQAVLKPVPWNPDPMSVGLEKYEAYYKNEGADEEQFIHSFGPLHGIPSGAESSSWMRLAEMQPSPTVLKSFGLVSPSQTSAQYLMHNLQRVTVAEDVTSSTDPAHVVTDRTDFKSLVVAIYSPLNETVQRTIVIRLR